MDLFTSFKNSFIIDTIVLFPIDYLEPFYYLLKFIV